jgi:hypothetical protein
MVVVRLEVLGSPSDRQLDDFNGYKNQSQYNGSWLMYFYRGHATAESRYSNNISKLLAVLFERPRRF